MTKRILPKLKTALSASGGLRFWPVMVLAFFVGHVLFSFLPPPAELTARVFAAFPVLHGGRVKPIDTVARVSLLLIHGKQTLRVDGQRLQAIDWLIEVGFKPAVANQRPVFRIDDPDVLGLLRMEQRKGANYSFNELRPYFSDIEAQAANAGQVKQEVRSAFERAVVQLQNKITLYQRLQNTLSSGADHREFGARGTEFLPVASQLSGTSVEILFNRVAPFQKSLVIYLAAMLMVFLSWLKRSPVLVNTAVALVWLAFVVHTSGLVVRMVLQGRPPVTNLYSSAIFVGWAAVILGLILERMHRNGVGALVASAIGFLTMIIAHHLASTGDTLEMMRAVLDSNFWLATHVVTVTIGYSSTFLSGFLALVVLVRRALQPDWAESEQWSLETMVFGVVCFSTFFSFLGTVLGGIWADQSWGRFWGWDPKENGALLIVLWNAFILHARKLGWARGLRIMMLAVFGNIITAFSWFGVNMLGIGLHSYGFMEAAFVWLMIFSATQVAAIALGLWLDRADRASVRNTMPSPPKS